MKINLKSMKMMNKRMILRHLVENGPTSRMELSRFTKLTPSTIGRIISELSEKALVEEIGYSDKSQIGRKPVNVAVTKKFVSSVVFNVGVEQTTIAIGFFDRSVKEIKRFSTGSLKSFISTVNLSLEDVEKCYPLNHELTSIVFAFPGIVNAKTATVIYAPNLNWRNLNLRDVVKYRYRIIADNEANLSVLAESISSEDAKKSENTFFLYVSQGIGGGAMINHQILRGSGFAGAEVGHTVVEAQSNIKCHCGNYGCLERYASLVLPVIEYEKNGRRLDGKTYTEKFKTLAEFYAKGDKVAIDSLEGFIHYLSIGLINITNTFNPEVVIIGGGFNKIWKYFGKALYQRILDRAMPGVIDNMTFRDTHFDEIEAPVAGANALAIDVMINNLD
ncbi:ROK family transcriptional regulator [Athalassotoga sp.]|uniref:ROK family transcriptional regulator n=1 Tax=Athalassotoga sp. TaxID=2022597 RepID=UPI003D052F08